MQSAIITFFLKLVNQSVRKPACVFFGFSASSAVSGVSDSASSVSFRFLGATLAADAAVELAFAFALPFPLGLAPALPLALGIGFGGGISVSDPESSTIGGKIDITKARSQQPAAAIYSNTPKLNLKS